MSRTEMTEQQLTAHRTELLDALLRAQQALTDAERLATAIDYDGVEYAARAARREIADFIANADNWPAADNR